MSRRAGSPSRLRFSTLLSMTRRWTLPFGTERSRAVIGARPGSSGGPCRLQQPQAQRVQLDEALRILLVVDLIGLEGDIVLTIEAALGFASDHADAALEQLEAHRAADVLLALVDGRLQHLALGREPESEIDELGIARHEIVFEMRGAAIERDALHAAVRREQDGAARGLIDAARLHADEAVLDEIEPADAVLAAMLVELGQELGRRQRRAVDRDGIALLEPDLDIGRLVRRLRRIDGAREHVGDGLDPGILQRLSLI